MNNEKFFEEFNKGLHRIGRIMLISAVILLVALPFVTGMIYGVMPDLKGFLSGFAKVGLIYIPVTCSHGEEIRQQVESSCFYNY